MGWYPWGLARLGGRRTVEAVLKQRRVGKLGERAAACGVCLLVALWGAVYLKLSGLDRRAPSAEQTDIAVHLVRGHGYRSPFSPEPSAPFTAWSPPVYPWVLSTAFGLWGTPQRPVTVEAVRWLGWLNAAAFGVVATCAWVLLRRTWPGRWGWAGGLLAVWLLAAHPMLLRFVGDYWDGMLALALFSLALVWADPRTGVKGVGSCLGLGVLLGLLLLTNTAYVVAAGWLVAVVALDEGGLAGACRRGLLTLMAMGVVLTPWTWRNVNALGAVVPVRSGAGFELWLGNRPGLLGWMGPEVLEAHPYRNTAEREKVLAAGEPAYSAEKARAFRAMVTAEPGSFVMRSLRRAAYLAVGEPSARLSAWPLSGERTSVPGLGRIYLGRTAWLATMTALGLAGVWAAWRGRRRLGWLAVAGVLAVAPYVVSSASDRYALPLRTMLTVMSAVAVVEGVRQGITGRGEAGRTAPRG